MKLSYQLLFILFVSQNFFGIQNLRQEHTITPYVDSLNRFYIQAEQPLYVYVSTSPTATPTQLGVEGKSAKAERKAIYLDGHGKHYLKHTDALHQLEDKFAIYADGRKPISSNTFLDAPRYFAGNQRFYGKNLSIQLRTKDEMSGIQNLYYSLNGESYTNYSNKLIPEEEGNYTLQYYAVDNVGNVETPKEVKFTLDFKAPNTFHNVVGIAENNVISTSTKIYLTFSDSISGVKQTYYRFDNENAKLYNPNTPISFTYLSDGEHTIHYYSIDQVANKEEEKSFTFYLDKTSPIMSADVLGDRFIVDGKVYFSGRTKLKLTAIDNKAGIKKVVYSIDGKKYETYEKSFYLPKESGLHLINYYAIDNMGNEGASQNKKVAQYEHNVGRVYVDLTGPILAHQFVGPTFQKGDTLYINNTTKMRLSARDLESGLQNIKYSIDKESTETLYQRPFTITKDGEHLVEYFGYDNVNNRNIKNFTIVVDNQGPDIFHNFSNAINEETKAYPSYVTLFLAATDANTTIGDIFYVINGGKKQLYAKPITGFKKNKKYTVTVIAYDKLGNKQEILVEFKTDKY